MASSSQRGFLTTNARAAFAGKGHCLYIPVREARENSRFFSILTQASDIYSCLFFFLFT